MQLKTVFTTIIILLVLGCKMDSNQYSRLGFWESVFEYLKSKHFINPILEKTICKEAIIHINKNKTGDYIQKHQRKIEQFLGNSIKDKIDNRNISEEEFQQVKFPIGFQNFNEIRKKDLYFTKQQKCGLLISAPFFAKNKAVLSIGVMYNPKSVADYLLFLEYLPTKKRWVIVNAEVLGFS